MDIDLYMFKRSKAVYLYTLSSITRTSLRVNYINTSRHRIKGKPVK